MSDNKRSGVEIRLDLPYGGGPAGDLCVDVYLPAGAETYPALLCLHGGAWLRGSKSQYKSWGPWLAERGYAVVAVDYRLSTQISPAWPGVWEDICRALGVAGRKRILDERRPGAFGHHRRLGWRPHGSDAFPG